MVTFPPPSLPHETLPSVGDLSMRAFRFDDAPELFERVDANRDRLRQYLYWVDDTVAMVDSHNYIRSTIVDRLEGIAYVFGMFRKGRLIGDVALHGVKFGIRPEIGYWIDEEEEGKGLTTLAARLVVDFAINTLGLDVVGLKAVPRNKGSNRIAEKLGFSYLEQVEGQRGETLNVWILKA